MRTLLAAVLLLMAPAARASFDDLGAGARAPGLGDAFTPLADDVYAIHYNPAGLAQLERPQLGAAYSKLYMGLSDGSDIGTSQILYAQPFSRGKKGTMGVGIDRFSVSGLYQEQTLTLSYGRKIRESESGSAWMGGLNAKYLTHSFTKTAEADNACSGLDCSKGPDPVLAGKTSKSAMDFDLGLLYRFPRRFQAGLTVQHLMSPSVGFAGGDKLERAINAGLAYKSLWLSLVGELKLRKSAAGSMERDMIFAAERFFPTLDYGQFGLRGALALGAGDYRQATLGASYRINKIQFDYAFLLPVGALKGQSGSHRIGLTFHFGAPTTEDEVGRDMLAQAKKLRERGPDYGYEYSAELKPQDLSDPRLSEIRALIERRLYRQAYRALGEFAQTQPLSPALVRLSNRLDLVAFHYTDLPEPKTKFDTTLVAALRRFIYGSDRLAVLQASYAYSMKTDEGRLDHLLGEMEKGVGIKAERLPADHPRSFMEELLYRVEFAHTRGDMTRVEALLSDILVLEPESTTAMERLGSLRYLTGRFAEAITVWEAALKIEMREHELESLREYLRQARERALSNSTMPGGLVPAQVSAPAAVAAPAGAPPESAMIPAQASAPRRAAPPAVAAGDPRDVAKLYQNGVEHYARGEYLQASAMFLRILQIDPDNEQARKALERIDRRRPRR